MALTGEQRAAVEAGGGNALVLAGPGTGKTTVIAARCAALLANGEAPERILTLTFSRRAAAELRERLAAIAPGAELEVRTFHGFASRLLEAEGPRFRSRRLLDALARRLVLERANEGVRPQSYAGEVWRSRRFQDEASALLGALERSLPETLADVRARATPRIGDLLALDARARELRARLRASDLEDLVRRAVAALGDERSPQTRWLDGRYEHVLVDEFQDVDRMQFELLASFVRLGARLFAVGDPAQAIYRFRGATHGILELARERFDMRPFPLTASQRCPQSICDLAAQTPLPGAAPIQNANGKEGAQPEVLRAATTLDEAALVADRIEAAIERGTPPERIAVLLRTLRPLSWVLTGELRGRGIPFVAPARDAFLADPLVEVVRASLELFRAPLDIERWRRLLSTETFGFDPIALRFAVRKLPTGGFPTALAAYDAVAGESSRIPWRDVARALAAAHAHWIAGDLAKCLRALVRELGLFASAVGGPGGPVAARSTIARVERFIDGLSGAQRTLALLGAPSLPTDVVARLDEYFDALVPEGAPEPDEPGVRILTIHGAKGLEFDEVIIADAVDGRFPQEERTCALLDAAECAIFEEAGVDSPLFGGERQRVEEAALWYVAATRTRARLTIAYACEDLDGTPLRPSRFIPASHALDDAAPTYRRSLERIESAAFRGRDPVLRASLADSSRLRRAPLLAAYLTRGDALFEPLEPRPVLADDAIAVGAVGEWYRCPRRYYYGRLLRLESAAATPFAVGTLLHDVLQLFHMRRSDFSRVVPEDVARWEGELHALLRERFEPGAFETRAEADAAHAFLSRALARYARSLYVEAMEDPFQVEACEENLLLQLGKGVLRGRIDRVDRASDGSLILRDYKSGRLHRRFTDALRKMEQVLEAGEPTYAGLAEMFNPQLALYRAGTPGVGRLDYIYFRGEKDDRGAVVRDETRVAAVAPLLERLVDDIRTNLIDALATGALDTIPSTPREKNCRDCNYAGVCDGPGGQP